MTRSARDMHDAVVNGMRSIGYKEELLQESYDYSDLPLVSATARTTVRHVELAAFAQSPPSMRNACFAVITVPDDSPRHVEPLRVLGAPAVFALHPEAGYIQMWKMPAFGEPTLLEKIDAADIAETFQRNEASWNPRTVLRAKRITFLDDAPQLDFCDIGLLPALEGQLRDKLYIRLNNITTQCIDKYKEFYPDAQAENYLVSLFRMLFRLLAGKLLSDRGERPEWRDLSAQEVVSAVEDYYRSSATKQPALDYPPVQNVAWKALHDGLNLQNLSVETLAHLYENLFITRKVRQSLSVHATPPAIAEYLVRQLPIHSLDQDKRIVFEPFSGAAPFLIAALGRLRELLPSEWSAQERHDYFVRSLLGIEMDGLAVEIARFALILADYPNPDGWLIEEGNAFESAVFEKYLHEANIVVCNPPFDDFSKQERKQLGDNTALTKEGEALRRILIAQPEMLGVVLPRAVLDRKDFATLRKDLVSRYRRISVTVFPDAAFNKALQEVVVITANNAESDGAPYVSAQVYAKDYARFRSTGDVSWTEPWESLPKTDDDAKLWQTSLQSVWDALSDFETIDDIAQVHFGVHYKSGLVPQCVSTEPKADFTPGVHTVRQHLETYFLTGYQYLCKLEEVMDNNAFKLSWHLPKVIGNRARSSRGQWHLSGVVDTQGLWASQQFWGAWPKNNTSIEVLAALLSGPVANAYLYNCRTGRDNQVRWIKQVPIPRFTTEQVELVSSLVREYTVQRGEWSAEPRRADYLADRCLELLFQIDATVLEAYALPPEIERTLLDSFTEQKRPGLPFDFPGYGTAYEVAKRKLKAEIAYKSVVERYHALVNKEFITGLSDEEAEEQERLSREIDVYNAPFYEEIFQKMDTKKG